MDVQRSVVWESFLGQGRGVGHGAVKVLVADGGEVLVDQTVVIIVQAVE